MSFQLTAAIHVVAIKDPEGHGFMMFYGHLGESFWQAGFGYHSQYHKNGAIIISQTTTHYTNVSNCQRHLLGGNHIYVSWLHLFQVALASRKIELPVPIISKWYWRWSSSNERKPFLTHLTMNLGDFLLKGAETWFSCVRSLEEHHLLKNQVCDS